jgi:uncharacterized membrane protein YkvA (DUF1232 family)
MRRLWQFRTELMIVWRAFFAPETPVWLKGLMLLIPAYLISPIDLIPDFIPVLGWVDDAVVIWLLVQFIVSRLPRTADIRATRNAEGRIIDGDYRRL